jgi:hypothetical protein
MTLNMLADTSGLATPRLNRTIIGVTTQPTTLSPTSQSASKEENDIGVPQPRLSFSLGKVGTVYLNSPSRRRTVIVVIAEVAS